MLESRAEREGQVALAAGLAVALVAFSFPFSRFVFGYFVTLVHEMGHTLAGWLFGYPSIPAFDFAYGGGVTSHQARMVLLPILVQGALLWLAFLFRRNPLSLGLSLGVAAFYGFTAWTGAHHAWILAMGHGTELLIAAIFLHRSFSGDACQLSAERPVYAFAGAFTLLHDLHFAFQLVTSPEQRQLYGDAKGGGHWMDFSRLANETFQVPLETVAAWFLVLCFLPPLLVWALHHWSDAWEDMKERLLSFD